MNNENDTEAKLFKSTLDHFQLQYKLRLCKTIYSCRVETEISKEKSQHIFIRFSLIAEF